MQPLSFIIKRITIRETEYFFKTLAEKLQEELLKNGWNEAKIKDVTNALQANVWQAIDSSVSKTVHDEEEYPEPEGE